MSEPAGSITRLIPEFLDRDEIAIEKLWRRYVTRMEHLARPVMAGIAPGAGDEQDVAQSAFFAFCEAAANGQAPQLANRNELWRLLATISRNKATDRVRHALRDRRGGGVYHDPDTIPHIPDDDPSPSEVAQLQEVLDALFRELSEVGDPKLQSIAVLRLEGATVQEIAERIDCTARTVQRKLHILERLWTTLDQ